MPADAREAAVLERIEAFRRRRPRLTDEIITLAHGAGGKSSAALVDAVFLEAFANDALTPLGDAARLELDGGDRLSFSTDSFVVRPRFFPGGSIGHLAVHGTVNDVAMLGARPRWLSAAFVIEEGFAMTELRDIVADMAEAARAAGVAIVAGDTKVVDRGAADGLYITTAGVGTLPAGRVLGPELVQPGDVVLVSGTIADHGMAVMLARGDLALDADIRSDTAPLGDLVDDLLVAAPGTRWMRDPTRGGLGTVCNELAKATEPRGGARRSEAADRPVSERRLRPARHRSALRGQRGEAGGDRVGGRGRRGPRRASSTLDRRAGGRGGRDQGRPRGHRGAPHDLRRHPHRRHARGRPAPAHLLSVAGVVRHRIRVMGTVQGVGFRPFVYRHAQRLGLHGWVQNDSAGVLLEVEGSEPALLELQRLLTDDPPPLARVAHVQAEEIPVAGEAGFSILASASSEAATAPVSVDTATCVACLAEVDDPTDRRYRYPFTNCTDCGPRYTIVLSVPYDRPATTMADFTMCPACQAEYDDPLDRRFHAQPNACPQCGPQLAWTRVAEGGGPTSPR